MPSACADRAGSAHSALPMLLLALSLLAGCAESTQTAQVEATDAVQDAVAEVSEAIDATSKDVATISADVTTPAVLAAREAVEAAAPAPVARAVPKAAPRVPAPAPVAATTASAETYAAWRSRWITCDDTGAGLSLRSATWWSRGRMTAL